MHRFRIGNDIGLRWAVFYGGVPYDLTGKAISIKASTIYGEEPIEGYTVEGNIIRWVFKGSDQKRLGVYTLTLTAEGVGSRVVIDECKAFELVARGCPWGCEGGDVELASNIGFSAFDSGAVRFDEKQQLTKEEQAAAIENIGAVPAEALEEYAKSEEVAEALEEYTPTDELPKKLPNPAQLVVEVNGVEMGYDGGEERRIPAIFAPNYVGEGGDILFSNGQGAPKWGKVPVIPSGRYPKMSVGFSENLLGDGSTSEEKFSFRPTAGENRNVKNDGAARIEKIKGNSVVWNNLVKPYSELEKSASYTYELTGTSLRGICTEEHLAQNRGLLIAGRTQKSIPGHKYLVECNIENSKGASIAIRMGNSYPTYTQPAIYTANAESFFLFYPFGLSTTVNVGDTFDMEPSQITDLTKMFGAGNEPATVEEFYQRLPNGVDLKAYNEREIINLHPSAIKTTGFNQWDEQWELGTFDTNGNPVSTSEMIRTKNPIRVLPNTAYYIKSNNVDNLVLFGYDKEGNLSESIGGKRNTTIVTGANTHYLKFRVSSNYGTTYKNDICINFSWDEYQHMNGMYAPYKSFERNLSWLEKYFTNGMRSAGDVRDEARFNPTIQKWEAVQNVGSRAFMDGDSEDANVTTDGTTTNYALLTPIITEIEKNINLDYDTSDYGTEELLSNEASAPIVADIVYEPNALASIKNIPDILTRLATIEAQLVNTASNDEVVD
uniref:hypothetical protein n=1 Tax=Alistipes sp. TaxID=1872444 RepID=UPI004057B2C6